MCGEDILHPSLGSAYRCTNKVRVKFLLHICRIIKGRSSKHCCSPVSTAWCITSVPGMLWVQLGSHQHSGALSLVLTPRVSTGLLPQNVGGSFVQKVQNSVTKSTLNYMQIYEHFSTFQMNLALQKANPIPLQRVQ